MQYKNIKAHNNILQHLENNRTICNATIKEKPQVESSGILLRFCIVIELIIKLNSLRYYRSMRTDFFYAIRTYLLSLLALGFTDKRVKNDRVHAPSAYFLNFLIYFNVLIVKYCKNIHNYYYININ